MIRLSLISSSVAFRLVIVVTGFLALAACAGVYAAYSYGRAAADQAFDRLLTGAALQIAERISVDDGRTVVDLPLSAFELLSLAPDDRVFYRVVGPRGNTLTGFDALPLPTAETTGNKIIYETAYRGVPVRAVEVRRRLAEQSISGQTAVIVAHTMDARAGLARDIAAKAMAAVALATLVIILITFWATRFALKPLDRIETSIKARDPTDLSPFTGKAPREIEALVAAINHFMGRLDSRVRDMQDFVADTAHQMRTPITAMRAQTELALEEDNPQRLKATLIKIRRRAVGVSRLMEQLLSQALVIHRSDTVPLSKTDLRRIALEAEREYRTSSLKQGDGIELDFPEDNVPVMCDPFSLREAIKNLLANAFTHGQPPVTLKVEIKDGFALLKVSDRGPGLSAEITEKAGDRYIRNEDKPESAGLGISIVRQVLNSHQGELFTWRAEDSALWLGFRLPLAKEGADA
ncbi:sensor histidine kinase [Rhizobium sp. L1K21]|uniref:sensor histidine kinase n=1 Tax=Rhizobium sp. L1K21 TaxID=2954933 RepID=UPI002092CFA5|nr:sensor histidine kinase [Rhizobium sp. L1K21]MCO6185234.1 sensor histidine kinase [Rhizobium sp. L1K21]